MIHYHVEEAQEGEPVLEFKVMGSVADVSAEVLMLINLVFNTTAKQSRAAAGLFRGNIQDAVANDGGCTWAPLPEGGKR